MSGFVASNGIPVTLTKDGQLIVENADHTYPATIAAGSHVDALREFFANEANKRPWHDTEYGDVWLFHSETDHQRALAWRAAGNWDVIDPRGNFHAAINDIPEAMRNEGFYGWEDPTADLIYRKEES